MNQTILKDIEAYEIGRRMKKDKVKWQNAVTSQNPHNFANNIGLINY